ncbi:hypothetical protein LCY76_23525 [Fictibacillus sp. KIGAM418]|uniref:Lipoprotein n=1 Tax=Fictibacillus marinisediminis TaxID=2878389 RepID=A0A9X2BJD2_9BACL|nr:hypothetical protein [Fictibacillus marinisediminis]MCK6259543.1 hypothetical protein [Fictibacillus marinisediminis]
MKSGKRVIVIAAIGSLAFLSGCFNNKMEQELAKHTAAEVHKKLSENEKDKLSKEQTKKENEIYKKMEKPINQVVDEVPKEKAEQIANKGKQRQSYSDPVEFAQFTGKILFEFYTQNIHSAQYRAFLESYGDSKISKKFLKNKDADSFIDEVQKTIKESGFIPSNYKITKPVISASDGYFYLEFSDSLNKTQTFIISMIQEQDTWKFINNRPAPPIRIESK